MRGGMYSVNGVLRPIAPQNKKSAYSRRGYLPHFDRENLLQSVTFRLNDSLPKATLDRITKETSSLPEQKRAIELRKRVEVYLDKGKGCCVLQVPEVAACVEDSLKFYDNQRYRLIAWVVMPNHVHVLIQQYATLGKIMHGWKGYTAKWMLHNQERLGLSLLPDNILWQREYWDRYIRNKAHYEKAVEYIHANPVKAGLAQKAQEWRFSSAWEG